MPNRTQLLALFETGDQLNQAAFEALLNSIVVQENLEDDIPGLSTAISHPWDGVKYSALGSSITWQANSFVSVLNTLLGSTGQNLGQSGERITPTGDIYTSASQIASDSQLILLDACVNDFIQGAPLGTIADTTPATFHGALYAIVQDILSANPGRQIVFCTQYGFVYNSVGWNAANANGVTLVQWNDAIRAAAKRMGVGCCEIDLVSGMGGPLVDTFTTDGLHIDNPVGADRYAQTLANYLKLIPRGDEVTAPASGWNLSPALLADLTGLGATGDALTFPGALDFTITNGGYCSFVCTKSGCNAIQFDVTGNSASYITVARGATGFSAVGGYTFDIMSFAFRFVTADGSAPANNAFSSDAGMNKTRFRVANVNGTFRIEAWDGTAWIVGGSWTVADQSAFTAGFKEQNQVGFVTTAESAVFSNIQVGTYVP